MRKTNINAVLKIVRDYLDGNIDFLSFLLDFPYEVEKRYVKMAKEDSDYADMLYFYLIESGTDKADSLSEKDFRDLIRKQYQNVMDGVY